MSNFNYFDYVKSNQATNQWIGGLNKSFNELYSPIVRVFKLDKIKTNYDNLYNEENSTRVYVEPFEIRARYKINIWKTLVGLEGPYENEDNLQLDVNFENMVQLIRELKTQHLCELKISYSGINFATIFKSGDFIYLKENGVIISSIDLNTYDTTDKVKTRINSISGFNCLLLGKNDASKNLISFNEITLNNIIAVIYSINPMYINMTDVIEMGDVILTDAWRVYEIKTAYPAGNMGWQYHSYLLNCELADLDKIILPGSYFEQIKNRQEINAH